MFHRMVRCTARSLIFSTLVFVWVAQVAYPGAWDLDNGAFGSVAGHPYWDAYIKLLTERAGISPAEGPLRYDHVVKSTGPDVTYDVRHLLSP